MPAGPKRRTPPQERQVYGLTMLHPSHPEVRRLQYDAARPSLHGHKVWPTIFVLMDYLHRCGDPPQARVLELGCGWGLVGIACAKTAFGRNSWTPCTSWCVTGAPRGSRKSSWRILAAPRVTSSVRSVCNR